MGMILVKKVLKRLKFSKNDNNKKPATKLKKRRNTRVIFAIENWLGKSEIGIFWSLCTLISKKYILRKSAIIHSIKLPFDVEAAKKNY